MRILHCLRQKAPATNTIFKTLAFCLAVILSLLALYSTDLHSQVRVRGYYRKDGTYVRPHVRTSPDGNPYNNYSFPGNYNPNTGEITPGNPDTYLRNYYNRYDADSSPSLTDVTAIQRSLKVLGYDPGPVDGVYGLTTRSALRRFQSDSEIANEGEINQVTINELVAALDGWLKKRSQEVSANQIASAKLPEKVLPLNTNSDVAISMTRSEFEAKYGQALGLYEKSRYQEAAGQFSMLLDESLHDKLADNSQYWIGECYFGLGNIEQSITEFTKVFGYTDTDKWDDAYLKLGLCYSRIGKREQAKHNLDELLRRFPESEYSGKAKQLLGRIQ